MTDKQEQSAEEEFLTMQGLWNYADKITMSREKLKSILKEHASMCVKKACKEQREICATSFLKADRNSDIPTLKEYSDAILNAPSPDQ